VSLPFVWLTVAETKGKTLKQMKDALVVMSDHKRTRKEQEIFSLRSWRIRGVLREEQI
jgi:hypothetical protein